MDANESRIVIAVCGGLFAFLGGAFGLAFASDEVKDRVDRRVAARVDQRVCQLMPADCPPPAPRPSNAAAAATDGQLPLLLLQAPLALRVPAV